MKENYPLIDLIKSEQPPFWVYNNYAYMYYSYLESLKQEPKYEIMGDYERKPKLDESLQIKLSSNPNLKGIYFIENESFEWVEQVYYRYIAESEFIHNWKYSDYTIYCFSAKYEFKESETGGFLDDDEIYNIEVYDFENAGLYPDGQKLDLLVKEYLRNIDFELTPSKMLTETHGHFTNMNKVFNFFNFHLENYEGNIYDFLIHAIEMVNSIWEIGSAKNIQRKKCFVGWMKHTVERLHLDPITLGLEPVTTPEPPQQQNENITQPLVRIKWNAPKNVLTNIFVQLKQMNTNQSKPVIDNSYEDLAVFLKTNFDCYQGTEISTIITTLKNQSSGNNIPKQTKLIEIRKSDL